MNVVEEIIQSFEPITLNEMDSVKLMNRSDTKYILKIEQLPSILEKLKNDYRVLEVNGIRLNDYKTLYYDTNDFLFYYDHHRGKMNRNKVRFRTYLTSNIHFFEIKNKNNKGKTTKDRIKINQIEQSIVGKTDTFLQSKIHIHGEQLVPKLWITYSRITFVNKHEMERLTIDIRLTFSDGNNSSDVHEVAIAELKQQKRMNTAFSKLMKCERIKTASISKYCFGIIFLFKNIKMNNFKRKLLTLNKIRYGTI